MNRKCDVSAIGALASLRASAACTCGTFGMAQLGSRGGAPKEVAPHHPPTQIHICARGVRPPTQKNRLGCWVGVTTHLQRHVYETFFLNFLFILYSFCVFSINFVFIRSMVLLCFLLDFSWANCCFDPTEQIPGVLSRLGSWIPAHLLS